MKNLWIKDGHLLDPANHRDEICDLYIKDGKVVSLDSLLSDKSAKEFQDNTTIIDAKGKYVMPGFLDLHVHLREPGFEYKETIKTGTEAAAKGGFTAVCPMPNTKHDQEDFGDSKERQSDPCLSGGGCHYRTDGRKSDRYSRHERGRSQGNQ